MRGKEGKRKGEREGRKGIVGPITNSLLRVCYMTSRRPVGCRPRGRTCSLMPSVVKIEKLMRSFSADLVIFSADARLVWFVQFFFRNGRKLMDRIFEATPMSGYGHPLRRSSSASSSTWTTTSLSNRTEPQSISSSASADRSGSCCCCCKCSWYC